VYYTFQLPLTLLRNNLVSLKGILTSEIFRRYWPDHVHADEGKRSKWTNSEIAIDHPRYVRKRMFVIPSVFTGGLTTSLTGMHCDIAVLDDVVVYENAYSNEGTK
jgi:hypothetical protein